jgi:cyanate lyase
MTASIIIEKDCGEIQAAMAVSLLQLKNTHDLTYDKIGKVIGREKQSVAQYICDTTEMPATCWLKAVAKWPELSDRLEYNLNEAERAFRARQRTLDLEPPMRRDLAA